jgi:hypothetical protein
MVEITRRQENLLLLFFTLGSLISLALVLNYSTLPSLPHSEVRPLKLYTDIDVMKSDTSSKPPSDRKLAKRVRDVEAVCWLNIQLLVDQQAGTGSMFTTWLDLPYGRAPMNYSTACEPAWAFRERYLFDHKLVVYIDTEDHNDVYLNVSSGSLDHDWSTSYDAAAIPPGLVVTRTVGDGIHVGGGFLLVVCIIGFLLPVGMFSLRCWEDRNPVAQQSLSEHSSDEQRIKAREGLAFTPLADEEDLDEEDARRMHRQRRDSDGATVGAHAVAHAEEIELEELDDELEELEDELEELLDPPPFLDPPPDP